MPPTYYILRSPRPTLKGIQQVIDSGTIAKVDIKLEKLVDFSTVQELEKGGFIDAAYRTADAARVVFCRDLA